MNKLFRSILVTLIAIFIFLPISSAQEQAGTKTLTIEDEPALKSPVAIKVYLYGKEIKSGVPFQAGDDWINDLFVSVTNKTDDDIRFLRFVLDFPTEHNGETMVKRFFIDYGRPDALKRGEENADAEERKIDKGESAVVTFNSNNPLSFEAFKNFKKLAPYDQKIWDRGILSVYGVEFEGRIWDQGFESDRQPDGTWRKNEEKERKLHERIKKATQTEKGSQIGFYKKSFIGKSQTLCYSVPPPPRTGATRSCSTAAGCQASTCTYFRPSLEIVSIGRKKILTSPTCSGAGCGSCCEPNVPDLGAICHQ